MDDMPKVRVNRTLGLEVHPGIYALQNGAVNSAESLDKFGARAERLPDDTERPDVPEVTILKAHALYADFVTRGWR